MRTICLTILSGLIIGVSVSYAQTQNPAPTPTPFSVEMERKIHRTQQGDFRFEAMRNASKSGRFATADLIKNSSKNITLSNRDKELISLSPEDEATFAEFLKLPKTGFIRLQDSTLCNESRNVINAQGSCPLGVTGKATAFSFRKKLYTVSVYSDIQNNAGSFNITGINQLGFLTNLGDVPIKDLNLESPGIKPMADFQPSSDIVEIQFQSKMAGGGFRIGEFVYRSQLPIEVDKTYALRSIAYEGKAYRMFGDDKIDIFEGDDRKDITLVFRVIRKYDDGSFGVIWRELSSKDSPIIVAGK